MGTVPWRMWHASKAEVRLEMTWLPPSSSSSPSLTFTVQRAQGVLGALCAMFGDSRAPHSSHCWTCVLWDVQDGHRF